jgi:hypothetical protein
MKWLVRPAVIYDLVNCAALSLIGSGVGVAFGIGPALITVGTLVLGLNVITFARRG